MRNYIADEIVPADKWAARQLRTRARYTHLLTEIFIVEMHKERFSTVFPTAKQTILCAKSTKAQEETILAVERSPSESVRLTISGQP